ncbi:MAG: hypothetical protein JWQ59_211 [Cryobacterium sp.]|jgi:hypothetical protein|nr:hypothetical protein [Cryobacterium sp.]
MRSNQQPTQVKAAEALQRAARDLADSMGKNLEARDAASILVSLTNTQQVLDEVFAGLAAWHGRAAGYKPQNGGFQTRGEYAGWAHAELALREAVQYGANVTAALVRARHASEEAQWIREETEDEEES